MAGDATELSRATYEYSEIAEDDIRLLCLESDPADRQLRFSLQPYSRDEAPSYVAISYHWGDEPPIHEIILNGRLMYARPYIWQALSHITTEPEALEKKWSHFWCDSICINQANVREKSEQIRRMFRTFEDALVVIAWLGPIYEDHRRNDRNKDLECPDWRGLIPWIGTTLSNEDIWSRELFQRPYLYRIWVVQELIAAKRVMFLLGNARLTYLDRPSIWALNWRKGGTLVTYAFGSHRDLKLPLPIPLLFALQPLLVPLIYISVVLTYPGERVLSLLSEYRMEGFRHVLSFLWLAYLLAWVALAGTALYDVDILSMVFPELSYNALPSLESWLIFTRHSSCSNPKDRIFALLNLLSPAESAILNVFFPDYDLSLERIQLITLAFLEQEGISKIGPSEHVKYCELLQIRSRDLAEEMKAKTLPNSNVKKSMLLNSKDESSHKVRIAALSIVASTPLSSELAAQIELLKRKPWYIQREI